MKKPIADLLVHCEKALANKWGYVWGTFGRKLTEELLSQKLKQFPNMVKRYEAYIRIKWLNKPATDCVGLIKGAYWWDGNKYEYDAADDVPVFGLFSRATVKGTIDTIQKTTRGLGLYKPGHVGVYMGLDKLGKPYVIEANSTMKGVIKTPLTGPGATEWTHWFEIPLFDYPKPIEKPPTVKRPPKPATLKEGAHGDGVKLIQIRLCQLGYPCATDGEFGPKTTAAVIKLQAANKIEKDGIVGPETQKVLDRGL